MPVGTEVDFDGTASNIPVGWEQVDNEPVYSTSETVCGTWFGKPLYRKGFTGNISGSTTTITTITDLDDFVDYKGYIKGGIQDCIGKSTLTNSSSSRVLASNSTKQIQLQVGSDYQGSGLPYKIILYYTKTTD